MPYPRPLIRVPETRSGIDVSGGVPRGWSAPSRGPLLVGDYDLTSDRTLAFPIDADDVEELGREHDGQIVARRPHNPGGSSYNTYGIYRAWPVMLRHDHGDDEGILAAEVPRITRRSGWEGRNVPDGWVIVDRADQIRFGDFTLRQDGTVRMLPEGCLAVQGDYTAGELILNIGNERSRINAHWTDVLKIVRHPEIHRLLQAGGIQGALTLARAFADNTIIRLEDGTDVYADNATTPAVRPKVKLPKSVHSIPLPLP